MKTVYRAANIIEADIVAGMLRSRGINAKVAGRYLQTAIGAAALPYSSRILVSEQQYEEALTVVAEYENRPMADESAARSEQTFKILGLFTKPVLFAVSLFLLLVWFFFSGPPSFTVQTGQGNIILFEDAESVDGYEPESPFGQTEE